MSAINAHLKVGAIFRFRKLDALGKPKYFLLMEPPDDTKNNLEVFLLTSKVEKYQGRKWTVFVSNKQMPFLPLDSVIDCNNYWKFTIAEIENRADFVGDIPINILRDVYKALTHAWKVPIDDVIRIRDYEYYSMAS